MCITARNLHEQTIESYQDMRQSQVTDLLMAS